MENLLIINEIKLLILSLLGTIIYFTTLKLKKPSKNEAKAAILIFITYIVSLLSMYYLKDKYNPNHLFMCVSIIFNLLSLSILTKLKLCTPKIETIFIFLIIISILLGYNCYSPYWSRQHDSRSFYYPENGGHFGYIGYIFTNNSLPNGSPMDIWCFYNPPLFYIVSTLVMKTVMLFINSIDISFEIVQLFSFIYMLIFDIYVYKILKEIGIKKSLIPSLLLTALAPAMIIMSGSINNDILSIMLSTMAIYYTIIWYKDDTLKNLIKIALTISLAIMTKISAALIAVAIAIVFLTKVIKNKTEIKKYIKHFAIFAIIALPIGLWFPIKNLVLYDMPITYVQSVDESNTANISKYSMLDRFFKINPSHLDNINIDMSLENADYNIYLTTIKSFIIDEYIDYEQNQTLKTIIFGIFYLSITFSIFYLITIIYAIIKRKELNNWMYFLMLIGILSIISYIKFCFDFPFTFTMNFRYIVPTLITYSAIIGLASDDNKYIYLANTILSTLFTCLSILMFTMIL